MKTFLPILLLAGTVFLAFATSPPHDGELGRREFSFLPTDESIIRCKVCMKKIRESDERTKVFHDGVEYIAESHSSIQKREQVAALRRRPTSRGIKSKK